MKLETITPAKSLNKAYFKQSITREQIEIFKSELQKAFHHLDEKQDEEYHKNIISDLFKAVYCKDKYLVNVNKREDLVIRLGNTPKDEVGVILEFKKPTEKRDMVSGTNANVKALQELVLYYLRQTVDGNNHNIKHLVVTNIYEWFIFDGVWFEKNIFRNNKLKKEFESWKVSGTDTKHFYDHIAAKYLAEFKDDVPCSYFNLKDYETKITNDNKKDDNDLIDLYKILSPEHLLKKAFVNDSNSLNRDFYNELLYIIGLEESSDTAKKTIRRINEAERNEGSLIENTIAKLKTKKHFGYENNEQTENQYYETALELCITWLNRILFLKLLESQLIKYHRGDSDNYSFLSYNKIKDFDELEELFFEVLAEKTADRKPSILAKYAAIPYLNSSLFEMTDLEKNALSLSNLKDRLEFPVFKKSVLKKGNKNEIKPKTSLNYLLDFLDAYNFSSESNALIQEENKSIINASVLGLIFEKINGYKDGSFFTPGFITMYMCRETIRKAVVEKFKTSFPKCENIIDFEELKDKIDYTNKDQRLEANKLVNDIKIVDPAVGSGHFLVSALNEMIAIKSDLQILSYHDGKRVLGYTITLDNDELIIQNQETDKIFEYQLSQNNNSIPDLQNLQECLFHEKQTIIENCLFGVDINPKSVMICQLRLWIELLKNAYYLAPSPSERAGGEELQTLPNIDINIKTGNSLISKFAIKDNVFERITGFQKKLEEYKKWVSIYKSTNDKGAKNTLKNNLKRFKDEFKLADLRVTKLQNDLRKLNGEFYDKYQTYQVFVSELTEKELKAKEKLEAEIADKQLEIQTLKENPIYENAFEWRFEFPEVLDDKGNFMGFDVVIGNPPYGVAMSISERNEAVSSLGKVPDFEIYYFFINLSKTLLRANGLKSFIIPNTILFNVFAKTYRETLFDKWQINSILDCTNFPIFDGATVRCIITQFQNKKSINIINYKPTADVINFENLIERKTESVSKVQLLENNQNWGLVFKLLSNTINAISKIRKSKNLLSHYFPEYTQGLIAYDKYKGQDSHTIKNRIFHSFDKELDWEKWLWGEDVRPYAVNWNQKEFINYNGEIANPREKKYFISERILIREITNPKIFAGYTNDEFYNDPSIINILNNPKGEINIKSLLGILNSKLATFYHFNSSPKATKGAFPKILVEDIKNFPLPKIDNTNQEILTNLVDQILSLKKENPKADISELENQIDELVYQLYELTPEEIAVVKG